MDDARLMRLFAAIADHGNLSAVAKAWGVAPSTVTHGLKKLEDRLGAQLLLRTTRQISLTSDGERFLGECRRLLADFDEVMTGFSDQGPLTGMIRLTATNDLGRQHIVPLIGSFMGRHPGLTVQLYLSDTLVDLVDAGFDLGIRTGPLQDSDLKARMLLRGTKCICASPEYWERRGKPEHPRNLSDHNCLVLTAPGETQAFWSFREGSNHFRVRVSGDRNVNDGQALKDWAIAGAGVCQKSIFDVAGDIAAGRLEAVLQPFTNEPTNLYAVFPQRHRESRRLGLLMDHLAEGLKHAGSP